MAHEVPSPENYTIPGGVKLFFDDGTGERDFGNIVDIDLATKTDELEHFTNRSGKRAKDKVVALEEALALNFKVDEPVIETFQKYFKGGPLELVGAGTAAFTDISVVLAGVILASIGQYYGVTSVTLRQFLDHVIMYDGAAYLDHSVEADTLLGTPFTTLVDADDELYLGKNTPFKEVYFTLAVPGAYGAVVVEYWNGTAWVAVDSLAGDAAALDASGKMNWTLPTDWAQSTVNGSVGYFIKITATTPWTTPATINSIRQPGVQNVDWVLDPGQATGESKINGRVGRLAAGFLVDGEEVKVTGLKATWTSQKFPIATTAFKEGSARLEVHPSAGRGISMDIVLPRIQLKPNGNIALDDKKFMEVPMTLEVLDNSSVDPAYPFGYVEYPE